MSVKAPKNTEPVKNEYALKAEALTKELGATVFYITFPDPAKEGKYFVGYFKEAGRLASIDAADLALSGKSVKAGHLLFAATFLKDHSSPEIEKSDAHYRTACYMLGQRIEMAVPDIKKN